MGRKDTTNIRGTIEFLKQINDILVVKGEVDPIYEISSILKAFDGGLPLLFENIKGYPKARNIGNLFSSRERIAKIFDVADPAKLKFKIIDAIKNPLPPKVVDEAPCQEVIISKDVDVPNTLPIIKHAEGDAGRILGGGIILFSGRHFREGTHVSFNRMHFQGKDWASFPLTFGSHTEWIVFQQKGGKVPLTVNIGIPPAVMLVAGGGGVHSLIPVGANELGIAGGIQGVPVEIVKAKTVDAYAIAQSEWVIEGYVDTTQKVLESEEIETLGDKAPFFPEASGYLGRARQTYKFQATAITHRKERPIFFTPLAHSFECLFLRDIFNEACLYEVGDRACPGLVVDTYISPNSKGFGVVYQVKKRRGRDEGYQKNILVAALSALPGIRLAIVVDDDIDIYNADDVMWAVTTRLNPASGIIRGGGVRGADFFPVERGATVAQSTYEGGLGLDCTIPLELRWRFEPGRYPVERINLREWFSEAEIAETKALQSEYAKLLAERGT